MSTRDQLLGILVVTLVVGVLLMPSLVPAASAGEDGEWEIRLEPIYMSVYGHDQHVMNMHYYDEDSNPPAENVEGLTLDTDEGFSLSGGVQYTKGMWGWGANFWLDYTQQTVPDLYDSAGTDGIDRVSYEVAGREYSSTGPGEVVFFRTRNDTALQVWTANLYAMRTLIQDEKSAFRMQLGLKNADFDNDYRSVVGIVGQGGTKIDAASNYSRMIGPMLGFAGDLSFGKSRIDGYLSQALVFGEVEQTSIYREYSGEFAEDASNFTSFQKFIRVRDVAIPMTEFRLQYTYDATSYLGFGLGTLTSLWWDVPVPPAAQPTEYGDEELHENTLIFFGLLGSVKVRF